MQKTFAIIKATEKHGDKPSKQNKITEGENKMLKFTIIAGLNDKDSKKQEITTEEAYNRIINILYINEIEGATFTDVKGVYIHRDGTAVFENSIKIELLF